MKKRVFENKKKKRILNKLGMTYVELLCALSLLSLIVVMFTPMLLSSYETLYTAGEETEKVYDSKEFLEQGLARRDSDLPFSLNMNLKVSAEVLFENINVVGRKIVSTMQQSMETVFGQVRPSLRLISPSHVNDDSTSHDILIQTKGLEFENITSGKFTYTIDKNTGKSDLPVKNIHVEVIIPDKTKGGGGNNDSGEPGATVEDSVYAGSAGYCNVVVTDSKGIEFTPDKNGVIGYSNEEDEGKIALTISNDKLDFTYSPLKIQIYYVDTRGKTRTVCEYIYIDPPTLIFAGETNEADYYTSAGVKELSEDVTVGGEVNKKSKFILEAMPRTMRIDNSVHLKNKGAYSDKIGSPSQLGTEIRSIRWISNDETEGLNPYYVMTGTKGAIYRMYNFTSDVTPIYNTVTGTTVATNSFFNSTQTIIDQAYDISTGHRIHASMWSGDYSHAFDFSSARDKYSSYGKSANHSLDRCWNTSDSTGAKGDPAYNVFSSQAQYAYYFNGEGVNFGFKAKKSRPISYILTEKGYALRLFGLVQNDNEYTDLQQIWDRSAYSLLGNDLNGFYTNQADKVYAFYYPGLGNDNFDYANDWVFSSVAIKALASYDLTDINLSADNVNDVYNYLDRSSNSGDEVDTPWGMRKIPVLFDKDYTAGETFEINVTDVIYIPKAGNVAGSTFYVGAIHAFSNVAQLDKINHNYVYTHSTNSGDCNGINYKNYQTKGFFGIGAENRNVYLSGAVTDFMIVGDDDGTGTYISKYHNANSSSADDRNGSMIGEDVRRAELAEIKKYVGGEKSMTSATSDQRNEFFFPTRDGSSWKRIYLDDVHFTLGYTSNREKVYSNITFDGTNEYNKSFEKYYWLSHYGTSDRNPNKNLVGSTGTVGGNTDSKYGGTNYLNSINNDYYNVWFPGEMYNLTTIASKDGVTVSVGYAVSGSTYQWMNQDTNSYANCSSTALGGIYNDGVLAAMVEGQDTALKNLLYYKDNESMNRDYLSKKKVNYGDFYDADTKTKQYGTHVRDSVQFTAVDIFVEEEDTTTEKTKKLNYWAVYGDNKGRAYISLVATGTATGSGEGDPDDDDSTYEVDRDISLVDHISDTIVEGIYTLPEGTTVPNMNEIKTDDGYTLDVKFSKITSIEADDNVVVITGTRQADLKEIIVVGVCNEGNWSWKWHQNGEFGGDITDAAIVNGYYCFVGYEGTGHSFLGAISIDTLKEWPNTIMLNAAKEEGYSYNKDEVIWIWTTSNSKINTIAGRAAN